MNLVLDKMNITDPPQMNKKAIISTLENGS